MIAKKIEENLEPWPTVNMDIEKYREQVADDGLPLLRSPDQIADAYYEQVDKSMLYISIYFFLKPLQKYLANDYTENNSLLIFPTLPFFTSFFLLFFKRVMLVEESE